MRTLLVVAGDRALTKFIAETLLGRRVSSKNPHLIGNGWDISRAHTALEAFLLLTRSGRRYSAVVIDQYLPDRSVLELLEQLKATGSGPETPVIVVAERGRDPLMRRVASEHYGVAGFIEKPVTAETVRAGIESLEKVRTVIVADRTLGLAEVHASALRSTGFAVEVLLRGRDVVTRAAEVKAIAVVSSLRLEDMSGAMLCRLLKQQPTTHAIPILLHGKESELSPADEIEENAFRAEVFLRAPFKPETLVDSLWPLVGRRTQPPPPDPVSTLRDTAPEMGVPTIPTELERKSSTPPRSDQWTTDQSTLSSLDAMPGADRLSEDDLTELRRAMATTSEMDEASPLRLDLETSPPASASPLVSSSSRRARRVPCALSVSMLRGDTIHQSETLNISDGGILIATDHPLEIGAEIDLRLQLPESTTPIGALGRVTWIARSTSEDGRSTNGVGIEFAKIASEDLERITDYVSRVSKLVYVAP